MKRIGLYLILLMVLSAGCAETITDIFRYGSVEVQAVRRTGEPVPGAEMTLYNDVQVMAQGVTNAQGSYRFEFVPPRVYGVHGEPPDGYARPEDVLGGPSTAYVEGIQMEEGTEESASFTYVKIGPGRMEVTVREADGSPVEGTEVILYGAGGDLAEAVVGTSGRVTFDPVTFGNRGVRVAPPPEYLDQGESEFAQDQFLIEEGWSQEVAFVLERCLGTIRGRVEDSQGSPVPGYPLRLYLPSEDLAVEDTGADGEVPFHELGCREYGLALAQALGWDWEEGPGKSFYDGIKVTRGSDQRLSFTVQRCAAAIMVRVEDETGTAVSGAPVELFTAQGPWAQGRTEEGTHTFASVPCGQEYGVRVWPPEGYALGEGRGISFFDGIRLEPDQELLFTFVLTGS